MKVEQQVVSLELAKQLKELGVRQDSHFCWFPDYANILEKVKANDNTNSVVDKEEITGYCLSPFIDSVKGCAAFGVAEMGELIKDGKNIYAGATMRDFAISIMSTGGNVYRRLYEGDYLYPTKGKQ